MSWSNWSLKIHIKLRTISSLVPTHITHVYVQWIPYSFVWLYLIKCVAHAQLYVDQIQKRFFSVLIIFGKCFCFEKFQKFQKLCNPVLTTLPHESSKSRAYTEALGNSLASQGPSHGKDLEKFQKSGFLGFS